MGVVYAEMELVNGEDLILARRNFIGEDEIKSMYANMLVDTDSVYMCINENIQEQLKLRYSNNVRGSLQTVTLLNMMLLALLKCDLKTVVVV